jgi:cytochrome c553
MSHMSRRVLLLACLSALPAAADTPGRPLAAACASCHRLDGHAAEISPLLGKDEGAIVQAMLAYRSGARESQIMHIVATALSPDEITAIGHYLASQKPMADQP